jgi:hypothetical protein
MGVNNKTGAPLLTVGVWKTVNKITSGELQAVDHGMSCRRSSGNRIDRKRTVEFASGVGVLVSPTAATVLARTDSHRMKPKSDRQERRMQTADRGSEPNERECGRNYHC